MQVFPSSVIRGFTDYRTAVVEAVDSLGHKIIRAEDFGASPDSPQKVCLQGVRAADIVVLLLGAKYGTAQPSGLSATHEEYREARGTKHVLVFVQDGVEREEDQQRFVDEVQAWTGGHYTESFTDPESLRKVVTRALHRLVLSQQSGAVDPAEMQARATALVPRRERNFSGDVLVLAAAGGPRQSILRPGALEARELSDALLQAAMFGERQLFEPDRPERSIEGDALSLRLPHGSLYLNEEGSIRVTLPAQPAAERQQRYALPAIIEEDVQGQLERAIRYVGWLLDRVDSTDRLTRVALAADLHGGTAQAWRTRAEHVSSPHSMTVTMNLWENAGAVGLTPPDRTRAALRLEARTLAEDLTVRLKRQRSR